MMEGALSANTRINDLDTYKNYPWMKDALELAPWLCVEAEYQLRLMNVSGSITGTTLNFADRFFPFRRVSLLSFVKSLDSKLLDRQYQRAVDRLNNPVQQPPVMGMKPMLESEGLNMPSLLIKASLPQVEIDDMLQETELPISRGRVQLMSMKPMSVSGGLTMPSLLMKASLPQEEIDDMLQETELRIPTEKIQLISMKPMSASRTLTMPSDDDMLQESELRLTPRPSQEVIWHRMHGGRASVHVDGTHVHNPVFVCADKEGNLIDVHPSHLSYKEISAREQQESSLILDVHPSDTLNGQLLAQEQKESSSTIDAGPSNLLYEEPLVWQHQSISAKRSMSFRPGPHVGKGSSRGATRLSSTAVMSRGSIQKPSAVAVPDGFVLKGDIKLFGLIPASLYSFQGTAMENNVDEMVTLSDNLYLGELIPSLDRSVLGGIHLRSSKFTYTNSYGPKRSPGLRFETDVMFEGELMCVSDTLKQLFNQEKPALRVSGLVALDRDWNSLFVPAGFTLSGSFEHMSVKLGDFIEFTSVGVDLTTSPAVEMVPKFRQYHRFSYGFFGTAHMKVPASVVPLSLRYYLRKDAGLYNIHLDISDDEWKDVCGVRGLNVSISGWFVLV